jgi:uncharacterized protein (DUF305 family)
MKKTFSRGLTSLALATAAAFALSACAITMPMGDMGDTGDGDQNAADVMFVQMMIPHHEQAVEMSEMILAKDGVDPEVVALAEQIRAAQDPEIELMEQWLSDWGLPSMSGMGGMDHGGGYGGMGGGMDGMMSDEQMAELQSADGAAGATLFLELMIEHHVGAVEMAEQVIDDGRDADVRTLAEEMIVGQSAEITTMRELLAR